MMKIFDELLEKYNLRHKKEEIVKVAVPAIGLIKGSAKEKDVPVGHSKFGGLPDLPVHFSFPLFQERPLSFLAQVNLNEAKPFDKENKLLKTGMLYFFYDVIEQPWGMDKEDQGCFKVLYYDGNVDGLVRTSYPMITEDYFPLPMYKITYEEQVTFSESPVGLDLDDDEMENFYEFREEVLQTSMGSETTEGTSIPMHYMLGEPFNVQNDVFEEIIYYSNEEKVDWDSPELGKESKEMVLLFQMDSDDDLEVMWGDSGILYFCIDQHDLHNKQFEQTKFTLQCY